MKKLLITLALLVLGATVPTPTKAQTYTFTLSQDASGSVGAPNANLPSTIAPATPNGDTSGSIYFRVLSTYHWVNIYFYPLNTVVSGLPYVQTLTSGPGSCTSTTKSGDNQWTLEIPETAAEDINGRPVTVSANYTLTNFYSRGGGGRAGGGAGCHYVFLTGGTTTITLD